MSTLARSAVSCQPLAAIRSILSLRCLISACSLSDGTSRNPGNLNNCAASACSVWAATSVRSTPGVLPTTRRSEEHTSELQSHSDLVCRLLFEKKKTHQLASTATH